MRKDDGVRDELGERNGMDGGMIGWMVRAASLAPMAQHDWYPSESRRKHSNTKSQKKRVGLG